MTTHAAAPRVLEATDLTRKRYDRVARTYDLEQFLPERLAVGKWREQLWSKVGPGSVLEVGVGTGLNFSYYPRDRRVEALDLSEEMLKRARARAERQQINVDLLQMDAQRLEFPDESFDWAVATFVFCSVPDPVQGLSEIRRVLRPGGRALLLEHVRSPNPVLGRLMDWLNPIVVRTAGANINRRTVDNVRRAGLEVIHVESKLGGIVKIIEAAR
jgi:phosphatidylethanolamine/phosphatidyl-N-methylethanolamine N-methyltransferase